MHSISRAQGFCFTLRIIQKSWSTPAVQIPPKSIWHDAVPFFSPSMHFPFYSVSPSLCLFQVIPFFFAFSRHFCLLPASLWLLQAETCVWGMRQISCVHQGQCRGLNPSQLREIGIRWLRSHPRHSCLYSRGLTGILTRDSAQTATPHWRMTPGWQRLSHRRVSPPTRAVMKPFNWSHPDLLFSQRKMQIHLFLLPFPLSYYLPRQRQVGACREAHLPPLQGQPGTNIWNTVVLNRSGGGGRAVNSHVASVVLRL